MYNEVKITSVYQKGLPKPGGPSPNIYIPQEQVGPVILLGTGFHFRRLLRLTGLWWRYSNPPPHRRDSCLKLKLLCDQLSVGQSALVSGSHLEPKARFFFQSDDCGFLDVGHPL
jgi:hypothetical protein